MTPTTPPEIPQYPDHLNIAGFDLIAVTDADLAFVHQGLSDPEVTRYFAVHFNTLEDTAQIQMPWYQESRATGRGCWYKICNTEGVAVGMAGFNHYEPEHRRASSGYWLLPAYHRQGIMSRVFPPFSDWVIEHLKLNRLQAEIEEGNTASRKVLQNSGYAYEGTMRHYEVKHGQPIPLEIWSKIKNWDTEP